MPVLAATGARPDRRRRAASRILVAVKLARYWVRQAGEAIGRDGRRVRVVSRGWSNESLEDARELARRIVGRLAGRLVSPESERRQYLYGERPLPEPVLREFRDGGDAPRAVVTRNAYGALVLNTHELMFVDIDRDDAPAADLVSGILSLFGKATPGPAGADAALADIQRVTERNGLAARVYKTAAGYRAIVTNARFDASAAHSEGLLQQFGADRLYVRLCRMQECFRARLTPKPWRCGLRVPPTSFPFDTLQEESRFRAWDAAYASATARYATCRYITTFGGARVDPGFEDLIAHHDQETKAASALPLA